MASLTLVAAALVPAPGAEAKPPVTATGKTSVRSGLGNGLGRLVAQAGTASRRSVAPSIDQEKLTIRDAKGRVLVDLTPQAGVDRKAYRRQAQALGLVVKAVDAKRGTLEGFAPLSAMTALNALRNTGTLVQVLKPKVEVGAATSQGVAFQRIDKLLAKGIDGRGVTVGVLSDSYDRATTTVAGDPLTIHAAQDVASGDLPGPGNAKYPQPVVVVDDSSATGGEDEGRGMLQIIHDVAPAAKLCFATADNGLVGFANNVRRLADKSGPCRADVIVDDVTYFDEPMFSDSVLSDAIDDVAAQGVHYFSSAGNNQDAGAWASNARLLPASTALRGTNLDFSDVDPALYDGGLQDMKTGPGTDVAQTVAIGPGGGVVDFQWDDPVDVNGATYGTPYFTGAGEITGANPAPSLTFNATPAQVGQTVQFTTDAIPSGTTDLILSVTAPDGTNLGVIDTGSSPEVLVTKLNQAGPYTITVTGYDGATGDFTVSVRPVLAPSKVTTDYNVLLFGLDGAYLGSVADLNTLSGRPSEVFGLPDLPGVQMVISRSGTGPVKAKRLRATIVNADAYFTEYSSPTAPSIIGHPTAKGATAVAAYDPYRSYLPESFTSAGGRLPVLFDSAGNRYATASIRQVPQIASTDGGNTTFFGTDTTLDPDSQPNFFGTSAAAPHAAGIAALAVQRTNHKISPADLRRQLKRSTFTHDLDPSASRGKAKGLTVTARGPQSPENDAFPGSMTDPNFFTVSYRGKVALKSVVFYGETASPTALGTGTKSAGIVFDPRPFVDVSPYRTVGFPFTVGSVAGVKKSGITASYAKPGGTFPGQYQHLKVSFSQRLKKGQSFTFGIDRDFAVTTRLQSDEGNSADELGGAVFIPSGKVQPKGMVFVATRADGTTFTGAFRNRLGTGFSAVDGFGLVNAEAAILGLKAGPRT
ncbi:S8 family serine peptidase [uncultured Friedmanniella sp.]|uniref:S8 family serine peptidase n=1 Tax=uncultured Friedmanniella sp. TaxID=335381 RepID=UPI0035CC3236